MVARGWLKAPKYLGVFKSVNPPGVPADLQSAVKKGALWTYDTPSFKACGNSVIFRYSKESFFRRVRNCSASLFLMDNLIVQVLSKV